MLRFALLLLALPAFAQQPYTLHVVKDLVQLPTLVLTRSYESVPNLHEQDFLLSMDSGPGFHPSRSYQQGDEPLNIALVLDERKTAGVQQAALLDAFQSALPGLPADTLRPQDRLSVFAFDCTLIRTAQDQPAGKALLQHSVDRARANRDLHRKSCAQPVRLWDVLEGVASLTSAVPGRRVVLVVSSGMEAAGIQTWDTVRLHAGAAGFSFFAVRDLEHGKVGPEDHLALLCGATGGLAIAVAPQVVSQDIPRLFGLIRNRYILEFPRPSNGTSGVHHLDVTVTDPRLLVSASGFSAPLLQKSPSGDIDAPPVDNSQRPSIGTRKPLNRTIPETPDPPSSPPPPQ